jgi:hypothetical protein
MRIGILRRIRAAVAAAAAHAVGFYTASDMSGLESRFVQIVDAKRAEIETLQTELFEYDRRVADFTLLTDQRMALPVDAPQLMISAELARKDQVIADLTERLNKRTARLREQAMRQPRDPTTKKFIAKPVEEVV